MKFLILYTTLLCSLSVTAAQTKKFCGKRSGTAGDASLDDKKGNEVIVLAQQGGDQFLLDEADDLIKPDKSGEEGTQNGISYCVVAEINETGQPTKIVKAYRQK